ncbi:MAG: DivIVA domain-containing protein [Candidatus Krumholzibacteria bacterium]|nr:DivIVA domain-containing protein [Candidatus Krumholzibacteria bacterium]
MRVTPLDIRKQEFKKVMRGLDSEEVYAFLNTIADEYEAVLSDNKSLRERLVALEERLNEFKAIETNLRNTLLTAEKLTHEAKENARREASLMIREAEMEAEKASETIRAHTSQLRREILELKKNKDGYIGRLKSLLDTHKKMLDGFQEDFAGVDQAIEKIGQQVEEDVRKPAAPPRMSRDKITEEFGHEPKDKVTWGDEPRRREDEPRPQMPRPGFETRENPNQKAKPPEDTNVFAAPGPKPSQQLNIEPLGATISEVSTEPGHQGQAAPPRQAQTAPHEQAQAAPPQQAQSAAPRAQDDWRQYEVRKQPTDWKNYEIPGQHPQEFQQPPQQQPPQQQPPQQQPAHQPAPPPRMDDADFESALSSLKEVTGAAEGAPQRRETAQMPSQAPAQAQEPVRQQESAPQPANANMNSESTWSMEDLRKNLTNLAKDEGNQG